MCHNRGKMNKGSKCCAVPSEVEYQVTLQVVGTKKAITQALHKNLYASSNLVFTSWCGPIS